MSTTTIIIIVAVVAVIVLLASRGGPRITEITRTRRREKDEDRNA